MEVGENRVVEVVGCGFTDVVEACPHELSATLGVHVLKAPFVVRARCPAGGIQVVGTYLVVGHSAALVLFDGEHVEPPRGDAGSGLAAEVWLAGIVVVELGIGVGLVIEPVDVDDLMIGLGGGPQVVVACGGEPGGVLFVAEVRQFLTQVPFVLVALFSDFVPDAPQDYAGMVAVTVDEGYHILVRPVIEKTGIAVGFLGNRPGIGKFIHHQESHPVAQVQEFRCGRVVGGTYGIAAHILEHCKSPYPCCRVPGCTQGTCIMMEADSFHECLHSVQVEPIGFELDASDTERCRDAVLVPVRGREGGDGSIEDRGVGAPERGSGKLESLGDDISGGHFPDTLLGGGEFFAVKVYFGGQGGGRALSRKGAAKGRAEGDPGLLGGYVVCPYPCPPVPYSHCGGLGEPDIAVDPATGIPPRRVLRVIEGDGHLVVPFLDERGKVCPEGCIAVRPLPGKAAVAEDFGIGHRPVYVEVELRSTGEFIFSGMDCPLV